MNHNYIEQHEDDYDLIYKNIRIYNENGWYNEIFKCSECSLIMVVSIYRGSDYYYKYYINYIKQDKQCDKLSCNEIMIKSIIE